MWTLSAATAALQAKAKSNTEKEHSRVMRTSCCLMMWSANALISPQSICTQRKTPIHVFFMLLLLFVLLMHGAFRGSEYWWDELLLDDRFVCDFLRFRFNSWKFLWQKYIEYIYLINRVYSKILMVQYSGLPTE